MRIHTGLTLRPLLLGLERCMSDIGDILILRADPNSDTFFQGTTECLIMKGVEVSLICIQVWIAALCMGHTSIYPPS